MSYKNPFSSSYSPYSSSSSPYSSSSSPFSSSPYLSPFSPASANLRGPSDYPSSSRYSPYSRSAGCDDSETDFDDDFLGQGGAGRPKGSKNKPKGTTAASRSSPRKSSRKASSPASPASPALPKAKRTPSRRSSTASEVSNEGSTGRSKFLGYWERQDRNARKSRQRRSSKKQPLPTLTVANKIIEDYQDKVKTMKKKPSARKMPMNVRMAYLARANEAKKEQKDSKTVSAKACSRIRSTIRRKIRDLNEICQDAPKTKVVFPRQ